jgi:hypothetical protein
VKYATQRVATQYPKEPHREQQEYQEQHIPSKAGLTRRPMWARSNPGANAKGRRPLAN